MSAAEMTLTLAVDQADADRCSATCDELKTLMEASPPWLLWLAGRVLESLEQPVDLVGVDADGLAAAGTHEFRVRAQVSDELLLLVAALRAGNGQGSGGVRFPLCHGGPHA